MTYTWEDFNYLLELIRDNITEKDRNQDEVDLDLEDLMKHLQGYLLAGVHNSAWLAMNITDYAFKTLRSEYYRLMFVYPIEDMPLWINDDDFSVIARWRLAISK